VDPALVQVYRKMSSAERVSAGLAATDMIRDRLQATIRATHADWTDEAVAEAVAARMLGVRD